MSAPSAPGAKQDQDEQADGRGVIRIQGAYPHIDVKDRGGSQSRHASTLAFLRETFLTFPADFTGLNFDFFIGTFDNPESCNVLAEIVPHVLTYSVSDQCRPNIIAIPDHIYGGWPEAGIVDYTDTAHALAAAGKQAPLHDKLFWIGNVAMHPVREKLIEIARRHPDDMECIGMNWLPAAADAEVSDRLPSSQYVSLPDHTAYSMLLDIRGSGYSGRLKLLMQAGRPVFMVERPFREFFYRHLRAGEHYMPVKKDLSDLTERVMEVKRDEALAARLGRGAASFATAYLSRDYALRHMRDVLRKIGRKA